MSRQIVISDENSSDPHQIGVISSDLPVFSADPEEVSSVFRLNVILPLVLGYPLSPVYPGFEDTSLPTLVKIQ
jgi:hypothetical protein